MRVKRSRPSNHCRRATAYAAVIGATTLITVIGLTALTAIRVESRQSREDGDFSKAMFYARSAIEKGLYIVASEPGWRSSRPNGIWEQDKEIGDGTYTLKGQDPIDALLANAIKDPVWVEGIGAARNATYRLRVELASSGGGYSCLEVPLHAGGDLKFTGALVTSNGQVSSNHDVSASNLAIVTANVEAVNAITGGTFIGTKKTAITPRVMPGSTVFDYYKDSTRATAINRNSLPLYSGDRAIQNVTLSPTSNPYGSPNANGFYHIDCGGGRLIIRNAKIVGTLTAYNVNEVVLRDSMNWESLGTNPSLLVNGKLDIQISATSFLLGLNLLPSTINGLFYVNAAAAVSNNVKLIGVLVAGDTINVSGTLNLTYDSKFLTNPPPGFGTPLITEVVQGSWRRLVD